MSPGPALLRDIRPCAIALAISLLFVFGANQELFAQNSKAADLHAADFAARCSDPAVVRCYSFDTTPPHNGNATGINPAWDRSYRATLDNTIFASGEGSLLFDIPARAMANSAGDFHMDFSDDFTKQFGNGSPSGDEFYVQWRQRFDDAYVHLNASPSGGGGMKQVIIGLGSQKATAPDQQTYWASSCTDFHIVVTDLYYRGFPIVYHNCGTKNDSGYQGLTPVINNDYLFQDAVGCLRKAVNGGNKSNCFEYFANEWMTFQLHVKAGRDYSPFAESDGKMPSNPNGHNYHHDSTVELWMAREGKPSQLVISLTDYDLVQHVTEDESVGPTPQWRWWGTNGGDTGMNKGTVPRYGKVWLLPYDTGRSITSSFPESKTWFDELIVSRRRIPDPWVKTPNPPDDLQVTNQNDRNTVTWRDNSDVKGAFPATGFVVERCSGDIYANCYAGNSKFEPVAKLGKVATWTDAAGSGRKGATYRVKAMNDAGDSAYSNAAMDTPGAVSDVTAQIVGPAAIEITWNQSAPADATSYFVSRCVGTYQTCQMHDLNYRPINCAEHPLDGNARKCTDRNLTAGAVYTYRVRSSNDAGSYKGWGGENFGATPWSGGTKRAQVKAPQ